MRLKQFIAIILMSFANIFILVHAVVPHYHHDGIVCFDSQKESSCKACHIYGEGEECCHETESTSNEGHHGHLETCDLFQIVERNGDPSEDQISVTPSIEILLLCVCTFECYNLLALADVITNNHEGYKPYIDTYNSPYVGSYFALRAPPSSIIS